MSAKSGKGHGRGLASSKKSCVHVCMHSEGPARTGLRGLNKRTGKRQSVYRNVGLLSTGLDERKNIHS